MQACDVAGSVGVGTEDGEEGAVEDGVVARLRVEGEGVTELEAGVDALCGGVLTGLPYRVRRVVDAEHVVVEGRQQDGVLAESTTDVEHRAADGRRLLECDDRGLWFTDNPRRSARLIGAVEHFPRWCCHI